VAGADVTSISVACSENLYTVGGTVSGLGSGSVVLQNNGGDDLTVSGNGAFTFGSPIPDSSGYAVTVLVQPAGQVCSVSAGIGTVGGSDVTDVTVDCADAYTIGGTVSGLGSEPVVLQNNGGDDLTITQDGPFTFSTPVADGSGYDVTVIGQPSVRTCVALTGVGVVAGADVTSIQVTCSADALSNRIAFHSDRDGDFEIYLIDPDGSNLIQLTDNAVDDFWPVVSPDGTQIAFWSDRDVNQEIYVMDADGSNQTRVTNHGAADRQPAWSPDGSRIAFHRVVSGATEVYTIKPDGTGEIRLTNNSFDDEEPAWSPDGSLIAFMTNRDGNNEVYVMNAADGSNPQNLSNNPGRDGKPDWSPDGSRLLFDRNNTAVDPNWLGDAEVMCMNADGSGQVRLTTDTSGFVDTQPRWSASGTRLVFNSTRVDGTNTELYVGRTNSCTGITNLNRITFSPAKDAAGDWSP
jgi:Tol biopolymer transport system component